MSNGEKGGSPIIIDGGGSITLNFDDAYYKRGSRGCYAKGTRMASVTITNASGGVADLSKFLKGDLSKCQIEISHRKPKGTITISAQPVGISFGDHFKKTHPKNSDWYYCKESQIDGVDFSYDGGKISFDGEAVAKGKVTVKKAAATVKKTAATVKKAAATA